jgi:ribosomal protein L4
VETGDGSRSKSNGSILEENSAFHRFNDVTEMPKVSQTIRQLTLKTETKLTMNFLSFLSKSEPKLFFSAEFNRNLGGMSFRNLQKIKIVHLSIYVFLNKAR